MKGKGTWQGWLCAMPAISLLRVLPKTVFAAEGEKAEWMYANMDKAIRILSQSEIVKSTQQDEKFAAPKSAISLKKSTIYFKTGDTVDLLIQNVNLIENSYQNMGVVFTINPDFYDEDSLEKDSFSKYGMYGLWPDTEKGGGNFNRKTG